MKTAIEVRRARSDTLPKTVIAETSIMKEIEAIRNSKVYLEFVNIPLAPVIILAETGSSLYMVDKRIPFIIYWLIFSMYFCE